MLLLKDYTRSHLSNFEIFLVELENEIATGPEPTSFPGSLFSAAIVVVFSQRQWRQRRETLGTRLAMNLLCSGMVKLKSIRFVSTRK